MPAGDQSPARRAEDAGGPAGIPAFHHAGKRATAASPSTRAARPVRSGFGSSEFDAEGRYVGGPTSAGSRRDRVYLPSGSRAAGAAAGQVPLPRRVPAAPRAAARSGREYILCGDWNIAHQPIDLKNWRIEPEEFRVPAGRAGVARSRCSTSWASSTLSAASIASPTNTPGGRIAARPGRRTSAGASTTRSLTPRTCAAARAGAQSTRSGASRITRR